jgi:hypothetical protein
MVYIFKKMHISFLVYGDMESDKYGIFIIIDIALVA